MKYFKYFLLISFLYFLNGCAEVANYTPSKAVSKKEVIAVFPFQNNTDTPLAGERVKSIMTNLLLSKGYKARSVSLKLQEDEYLNESKIIKLSKKLPIKYYIFGSVNEYRYKSGIEAQPAVAISFKVVDKDNGDVIYGAVGAKSGWGGESLGTVTQKLIEELIFR